MNQTASKSNVESTLTRTKLLTNRSNNEPNNTIQLRNLYEHQIMKEPRISIARAKIFFWPCHSRHGCWPRHQGRRRSLRRRWRRGWSGAARPALPPPRARRGCRRSLAPGWTAYHSGRAVGFIGCTGGDRQPLPRSAQRVRPGGLLGPCKAVVPWSAPTRRLGSSDGHGLPRPSSGCHALHRVPRASISAALCCVQTSKWRYLGIWVQRLRAAIKMYWLRLLRKDKSRRRACVIDQVSKFSQRIYLISGCTNHSSSSLLSFSAQFLIHKPLRIVCESLSKVPRLFEVWGTRSSNVITTVDIESLLL